MAKKVYLGTAKRKTSIAKATLKQNGSGRITINKVPYQLLPEAIHREKIEELIHLIGPDVFEKIDINVKARGGGVMSQVNAARTAIAKAILAYKNQRDSGYLYTRIHEYDRTLLAGDARQSEPKKFGGRGARARRQKSYR